MPPIPLHVSRPSLLAALIALLSVQGHAGPLVLSQSPPASVKEPPPNVMLTIDDSRSLGTAGLQALKDALKATFAETGVPRQPPAAGSPCASVRMPMGRTANRTVHQTSR